MESERLSKLGRCYYLGLAAAAAAVGDAMNAPSLWVDVVVEGGMREME